MKYPKEWVDVIKPTTVLPDETLDRLRAVGALKEPPVSREFGFCTNCGQWARWESCDKMPAMQCDICSKTTFIHVREVLE